MKRLILTLIALTLLIAPSLAMAANWNVDPDHSAAHFKVQHMMIAGDDAEGVDIVGGKRHRRRIGGVDDQVVQVVHLAVVDDERPEGVVEITTDDLP